MYLTLKQGTVLPQVITSLTEAYGFFLPRAGLSLAGHLEKVSSHLSHKSSSICHVWFILKFRLAS